jgi:site-specific recombinase XerD
LHYLSDFSIKKEKEAGMQYEKLFKSKHKNPPFNEPHYFHSFFAGDLFFDDPKTKFPAKRPNPPKAKSPPTQRELYRNRILEKISTRDIPGKKYFAQYIRHKFRINCKPNTIRNDYNSINLLLTFMQSNKKAELEQLHRSDLEAFIEQEQDRGLSPSTLQNRLASVYAFIRFFVENKIIDSELLERKIHIKQPVALPKSMDTDDVDKILTVIDSTRDRAMIMLLLRTGMRIGELLNTKMSDVNLEEQQIRIIESEKTGTGRVAYFSNDAAEALYHWLKQRDFWKERLFYAHGRESMTYATARVIFKKYLERTGLSHKAYTLHCLRHTYATGLLNARIPIDCLRDLLGHKNLEQTRRYANLSDKMREEEYFKAMAIIERGNADEHDRFDH